MGDPDTTQVQVYRETLVLLRQIQLKQAGSDGKVPPMRDVVKEIVERAR